MRCLCVLGSLRSFWEMLQRPRSHAIIHLNSYRFSFPIKCRCIISYECNHRASPSPLPSRRLGAVCVCASMCAHHFYPERETELCRGLNRHVAVLLLFIPVKNNNKPSHPDICLFICLHIICQVCPFIHPSNRKTNIVLCYLCAKMLVVFLQLKVPR